MGQFTRWVISTSQPIPGVTVDSKRLYGSRGDAVLSAYRIATAGQPLRLQRDQVAAHGFMETLLSNSRAVYRGATWYVKAVEPVYFEEVEKTNEQQSG
ncbi:hypothetical protein [Streptomyces sp. CBMA29]|uniref:hypothetical protein n=1 Tax=Streptomyces sp. CBMA29 TaxID=1896314 RepID=UPI001661EB7B|nr:hypothetical protein [Streptomyces sp. CBMA29]